MLLLEIIEDILPIILLMVLGYFLREKKFIDDGLNKNLAFLVMNIALPSSIFVSVIKTLDLSQLGSLTGPLISGVVILAILYLISFILVKVCRIPHGRQGSFINGIVNTNSLFIGMPLNAALFGDQSITYFLVFYVLSLLSIWTVGATLVLNDPSKPDAAAGGARFQPKTPASGAAGWLCCCLSRPPFWHLHSQAPLFDAQLSWQYGHWPVAHLYWYQPFGGRPCQHPLR